MTKQEKIIVSAYTGVLMCNFEDVHEYIQKKFGRPVFIHELADKGIQKEVRRGVPGNMQSRRAKAEEGAVV